MNSAINRLAMHLVSAMAAGLLSITDDAVAQERFPSRPVTMISTFAPGGITDTIARTAAGGISENLGQPVVVDFRPGGNGAVGMSALVKATPDGHTIGMTVASVMTLNPLLVKGLPYDPIKDVVPISNIGSAGLLIVSNPALPARNFAEYVELARKKPESVSFGIVSAAGKLVVAMIDSATGAKLLQVPFGGTALSYTAMFGGHIDSIIDAPASSRAFIQAGKARALAVTSPQRSQLLPDVPTVSETLPGFEFVTWFGLFAPASTPMDRVENLSRSLRKALDTPKMREALAAADLIPAGNSSQDFASNIRAEFERNRQIVQRYAITN